MTGSGGRDERFRPRHRLRSRKDFQRCYRRGKRRSAPHLSLHFAANQGGEPRLGITASRRVGNSVVRHRLKRRIREIFRRWERRSELPAVDLVVHLKPGAGSLSSSEIERQLVPLLEQLAQGRRR